MVLSMARNSVRAVARLSLFLLFSAAALMDFALRVWLPGRAGAIRARTEWCRRWGRRFAACLRLDVAVQGSPPVDGFLVSNHLSYLDIVAYATTRPLVFVSKAEVRSWPGIGWLTRCAGTLFLKREAKADVVRVAQQFAPLIQAGEVVALFPEGTSSGGETVLPFKPSLFAPATEHGWAVTPSAIRYELEDGEVSREVAYWADMTFGPHFLNLLSKRRIRATIRFGDPIRGESDRKALAKEAEARVRGNYLEMSRTKKAADA
jgi:1-acyl-sn-glycerol-3-phosphate acyltransferase